MILPGLLLVLVKKVSWSQTLPLSSIAYIGFSISLKLLRFFSFSQFGNPFIGETMAIKWMLDRTKPFFSKTFTSLLNWVGGSSIEFWFLFDLDRLGCKNRDVGTCEVLRFLSPSTGDGEPWVLRRSLSLKLIPFPFFYIYYYYNHSLRTLNLCYH